MRADAFGAIRHRDLTDATRASRVDSLGADDDPVMRLTAVGVMSNRLPDEVAFELALERAARSDPDETVRERASQVLAQARTQP